MEHIDLVVEEYSFTRGLEQIRVDLVVRLTPVSGYPEFWVLIVDYEVFKELRGYPLSIFKDYYCLG